MRRALRRRSPERQLQASPAFVPCVQRLMELVGRWGERSPLSTAGGSWNLTSLALEVLATLCASPDGPRVRWLLRAHRVHERHYDHKERQWLPLPPRAEGEAAGATGGFFGVLPGGVAQPDHRNRVHEENDHVVLVHQSTLGLHDPHARLRPGQSALEALAQDKPSLSLQL